MSKSLIKGSSSDFWRDVRNGVYECKWYNRAAEEDLPFLEWKFMGITDDYEGCYYYEFKHRNSGEMKYWGINMEPLALNIGGILLDIHGEWAEPY